MHATNLFRSSSVTARILARSCIGLALVSGWQAGAQTSAGATNSPAGSATAAPTAAGSTIDYSNWIEFSVGSFFVNNGDKAAAQRRHSRHGGVFGGLQDLHYEQQLDKKTTFTLDARALFDEDDYLLRFGLQREDLGFVRGGHREFRTWYDGSGGFFPGSSRGWFSLYDDELAVDRAETFFEAGLTIPDVPKITLRYSHLVREGRKNSTSWGEATVATGTARKITPTFWEIDEERHIFDLDARHTVDRTDFGIGLRYELSDNDNTRNMRRSPGEATDRFLKNHEGTETDLFHVRGWTETRLREDVLFTTGYSYTTLDTDISGERIYGSDYEPVYDLTFPRLGARDHGFPSITGGSQLHQHVANLNLMWTPTENFSIVPSLRIEASDQDGFSRLVEGAGPPAAPVQELLANEHERGFIDVSERLEARYTGFTNWVLYARGEWLQGQGDVDETQTEIDPDVPGDPHSIIRRKTDSERLTQKYSVGANWYPLRNLNFAGQYYHKVRDNDYEHDFDNTDNRILPAPAEGRYPAFITGQDFTTDDVNFRVTYRPRANITLVSRYDYQLSTVDSRMDGLPEVESAELTTHILSQSIAWTPFNWLYFQASVNYVMDEFSTPANRLGGLMTSVVPTSRNDYWNGTFLAGFALDDKTDLQAQYSYFRADNYDENDRATVPLGPGYEEHAVSVGVTRQFTKQVRWNLRYGWFTWCDELSGGNNDFTAHLIYSSVQYRF